MDSVQIQSRDLKYFTNNPNFNPDRNKAVINETIRDTEKFFKDLQDLKDKESEKRIDILSSYGLYRFNKGTKKLKDYLGRSAYNSLLGDKIRDKVRAIESVNKLGKKDTRILI